MSRAWAAGRRLVASSLPDLEEVAVACWGSGASLGGEYGGREAGAWLVGTQLRGFGVCLDS